MDRFDRIAIGAIVVLAIGVVFVARADRPEPRKERSLPQRGAAEEQSAASAELDANLKVLKGLLEADGLAEAETLAQDLVKRHPFRGEPHMLLGDVLMRKQDPIAALYAYKRAIDLDPDYLDRKTQKFQGKKLKVAAGEALAEIESRLKQRPGDEGLKAEKKTVHYLYRKIAGSCG